MKAHSPKKRRKNRIANPKMPCKALTRSGSQCKKTPMKGSAYCYLHCMGFFYGIPLWKHPISHLTLTLLLPLLVSIGIAFIQHNQAVRMAEENRVLTAESNKLIEYNTTLLENLITDKYETDLQIKYPGGYTLFGIDHTRKFKNESIPHKSHLLEQFEFDWRQVTISAQDQTTFTIVFPGILYKPLQGRIAEWQQTIPKFPKGESYRLKINLPGAEYDIFCELVEYRDPFYVFAIGFKPK
jgi:hypothetical protein